MAKRLNAWLGDQMKRALEIVVAERKLQKAEAGDRGRVTERTILEEALESHPDIQKVLRRLQKQDDAESRLAA